MPDASHDDPISPNAFTLLRMIGISVPPYSARGIRQSLAPIQQAAQLKRTVNGALKDLAFDGFQKYASTISVTDQRPPNFDGLWPGKQVIIDCVAELSYCPDEGQTRQRTAVPGSETTEGAHNIYRPRLTMRVTGFQQDHDEYGAAIGWSIDLEEV